MEIQGPQRVPGTGRVEGRRVEKPKPAESTEAARPPDSVEISGPAKFLDALSKIPDIRQDRVEEIKKAIEKGEYITDERIEETVNNLLEELW